MAIYSKRDGKAWFRFPLDEEGTSRLLAMSVTETTVIVESTPPPKSVSKAVVRRRLAVALGRTPHD